MRIGYGRVSTRDQNPDGQRDALAVAGCDEILIDKASGKLASRPALDNALRIARAGDQLVVTKLDRLGRSLEHLIALSSDLQTRRVDLVVLDQVIDTSTAVGRNVLPDPRRDRRVRARPYVRTHPRRPRGRPAPGDVPAARSRSSPTGRRRSRRRCTTSSAPMAGAPTPSRRSPTSSASPAQRSTATYSAALLDRPRARYLAWVDKEAVRGQTSRRLPTIEQWSTSTSEI
jgi:hypothetical protein